MAGADELKKSPQPSLHCALAPPAAPATVGESVAQPPHESGTPGPKVSPHCTLSQSAAQSSYEAAACANLQP